MYKLPKETLDELLNYLATKPYVEVYQLVAKMQQAEEVVQDEDLSTGLDTTD